MSEAIRTTPEFPYSERSSAHAPELMQQLLAPPEIMLSDQGLAAASVFAEGLFTGVLGDKGPRAESKRTLLDIYRLPPNDQQGFNEQAFYLDYFTTPAATADLAQLGMVHGIGRESLVEILQDTVFLQGMVTPESRNEIAKRSEDWHKAQLAERLKNDPSRDWWEAAEPLVFNYEPDELLTKLQDLMAYRRFYRVVRKSLRGEPDSDLKIAKQTLLDCHIGRVNSMMTDLYPNAISLARQLDRAAPTQANMGYAQRLADIVPTLTAAVANDGFARRLDMVRNGVAVRDGALTPVSGDVLDLTLRLAASAPEAPEATLPDDVIALMDSVRWNAGDMKQLNELILAEDGRLSAFQSTWEEVSQREGPAPDGKWQVVVSPKKDTLAVAGDKRVMWVPERFNRPLGGLSPAGALPVSAHEQTHVEQTEYDDIVAQQIPLAGIKGRRYVTMREMGGIYQEREFQQQLGRLRPTNLHYLRALQVKEAGGTFLQAARAFYDSFRNGRQLDAAADARARADAVDRTQRLYRYGGTNSQPLDYIEQELIVDAMAQLGDTQRAALVIAGGSFCLADAAALHRVGLLDLPMHVDSNPTATTMKVFSEHFLPALQAA